MLGTGSNVFFQKNRKGGSMMLKKFLGVCPILGFQLHLYVYTYDISQMQGTTELGIL